MEKLNHVIVRDLRKKLTKIGGQFLMKAIILFPNNTMSTVVP